MVLIGSPQPVQALHCRIVRQLFGTDETFETSLEVQQDTDGWIRIVAYKISFDESYRAE